jgi:hypothetical protein
LAREIAVSLETAQERLRGIEDDLKIEKLKASQLEMLSNSIS